MEMMGVLRMEVGGLVRRVFNHPEDLFFSFFRFREIEGEERFAVDSKTRVDFVEEIDNCFAISFCMESGFCKKGSG